MMQILSTDGVEVIFKSVFTTRTINCKSIRNWRVSLKQIFGFHQKTHKGQHTLLFKFVCILLKRSIENEFEPMQFNMIRIIQNWVKTIDIKSSRTYQVVVLRILQTDCLNRRVSLKESGVKKLVLVVVFCTLMKQRSSLCFGLKTYLVENNIRIHLGCNR